jgi:hypothetical protein
MFRLTLATASLLFAFAAQAADTCETITSRIESRIRASGVQNFTLTTLDVAEPSNGKVVGSCGMGSKKIVYALVGPSPAAAKLATDAILTECKDGSISRGGDCKK